MGEVLFLTQVLPYPLAGGAKIRAYWMLRYLAARYRVTLVSFVREDDTAAAVAHLRTFLDAVVTVPLRRTRRQDVRAGIKGMVTGLPMVIARDEVAAMQQAVRELARQRRFDVIHADQTAMAQYGLLAAEASGGPRPRTVLDQHNAVYKLAERMADEATGALGRLVARREARAFRRYEAGLCRQFDAVLTVTDVDRERLLALFAGDERAAVAARMTTVPIAVDPDGVAPVARQAASDAPPNPPTIVHVGTMFWPPNVAGVLWFARAVLPLIQARLREAGGPEARLVVVGKQPPAAVTALAADARVTVTGYVADVRPILADADAFVIPLHAGGGMRVKLLDAWQWGVPVVTTTVGAEGIDIRPGTDVLVGDTPEAFAEAVVALLTDRALNARLRDAGRRAVAARYDWRHVYRAVDTVYAAAAAQGSASLRNPIRR